MIMFMNKIVIKRISLNRKLCNASAKNNSSIYYRTVIKIYIRKNIKLQQLLNQYERDVYFLKNTFNYFKIHLLDIYTILNKSGKEEEEE